MEVAVFPELLFGLDFFELGPGGLEVGEEEPGLVHEHFDDFAELLGVVLLEVAEEGVGGIHDNIITAEGGKGRARSAGSWII